MVFVVRSCVHVYTAKGKTILKVIRQKTTKSVIVYFNHHSALWFSIHLEIVRGKTKQTNKTKTRAAGLLPEVDLLYASLYLCGSEQWVFCDARQPELPSSFSARPPVTCALC